jgi:hypothetical protein
MDGGSVSACAGSVLTAGDERLAQIRIRASWLTTITARCGEIQRAFATTRAPVAPAIWQFRLVAAGSRDRGAYGERRGFQLF